TQISIAVLDVQVGMAEPAALDADEDFAALRLRRVDDGFAQRRIEFDQRLATHQRHGISPLSRIFFRAFGFLCFVYRSIRGPWQQSRKPEWSRPAGWRQPRR